jgi:hypothetical protein
MTRNRGKDIDARGQMVRDRDGIVYPVERMLVGDGVLYYGRPLSNGADIGFDYHELWAFDALDLVVSRLRFLRGAPDKIDWYIETDPIDVDGDVWRIRDGYLDVCLYERERYRLEDAGELAEGLASGAIFAADAVRALQSLERVLALLERNGRSGAALLAELAPGLPQ